MIYVFILGYFCLTVGVGVGCYFLGRFHAVLLDKIRTLDNKTLPPEPEKPAVTGGAYQPPREFSNAIDSKQGAGIVETKTPQQLDWENQNEIAKLEHGA